MACQLCKLPWRTRRPGSNLHLPQFFFKIFWCLRSRFVVCSIPHSTQTPGLHRHGCRRWGCDFATAWAVDVLGSYFIIFHTTCFRFLCRNAKVPAMLDQCMAAPQRSAVVRVVLQHVGWPCLNKGGTMRFARMKRMLQKCHEWNQVEAVHCLLQARLGGARWHILFNIHEGWHRFGIRHESFEGGNSRLLHRFSFTFTALVL